MSSTITAGCLITVFALIWLTMLNTETTGHSAFEAWKAKYMVSYDNPLENDYRQSIYFENLAFIEAENKKGHSYELAENQFMDLKKEEFVKLYLRSSVPSKFIPTTPNVEDASIPQIDVDWVAAGAVTSVKNQGSGGSEVPLVAASAFEAITKIRDGRLQDLPEQTLEDCVGSNATLVQYFDYVQNKGTIYLNAGMDYIYVPNKCIGPFRISSYTEMIGSCTNLNKNMTAGPVVTIVDATSWQFYKSGILTNCPLKTLNHCVLVVASTDTYWQLKNTWGAAWGESGYIRIGPGNTCGLCTISIRPIG